MKKKIIAALVLWSLMPLCAAAIQDGEDTMMMNEIREQIVKQAQPYSYDAVRAEDMGLAQDGAFSQEYFSLHCIYKDALIRYLNKTIGIEQWDAFLLQNAYIPNREPVSVYQAYCADSWKFFFVRSNICIEKLSEADIAVLRLCRNDEDLEQLVEHTLADVITADGTEDDDIGIVFEADGKIAQNKALVLGVAVDAAYDEKGNYTDAEKEEEKAEMLRYAAGKMEEEFSAALGIPVSVFVYE